MLIIISLFLHVQLVSEAEVAIIDKIIDMGSQRAGDLDYYLVHSLYKYET